MLYLDLAELDRIFERFWLWSARRPALAWFRRSDHMGEARRPLEACVRDLVERETGRRPDGPIRLLTHLRYFGYCFNPISVYYCFDRGDNISDVVLEVSNTPWGEMHCYVLPHDAGDSGEERLQVDFEKSFHVSPFLPMDMRYRARITKPETQLFVGLENWRENQRVFDAHLALKREPIGHAALARHLLLDPFITMRVLALILWQALKLWIKRAPIFDHPEPKPASRTHSTP
jgi:DUF1365 family protein